MKGALGSLHSRFDVIDGMNVDNPRGIRFASVVQEAINWDQAFEVLQLSRQITSGVGISEDDLAYYSVALGMLVTGEPQFVSVEMADQSASHALVVYAIDANGLKVADPNYPGEGRTIPYGFHTFGGYATKSVANEPVTTYTKFFTLGITNLFATSSIDAQWPKFMNGTIGNPEFPSYEFQHFDVLDNSWQPMSDTVRTRQATVRLRVRCPSCPNGLQGTTVTPIAAFGTDGTLLDQELTLTSGISLAPAMGGTAVGLYVGGVVADDPAIQFIDFQWRTIVRSQFALQPASTSSLKDSIVKFTARPFGDVPAQPRYVWNFGDQTAAVTIHGDSVATHKYTKTGSFTLNVELQDAVSGSRLASASGTVSVSEPGDTLPVWRITRLTLQSLTGAVPHDTMAKYTNLVTYFEYFLEKRALADIGNGNKVAYVHATNGATALRDCYDFDGDNDKTELITWPAWIWIQFPHLSTNFCGNNRYLDHYPWDDNVMWLGFDIEAYYRTFAGVTDLFNTWDYPANAYASVSGTPGSETLSGRAFQSVSLDNPSRPNRVQTAREVIATSSGNTLSGTLTFIYRAYVGFTMTATWTATYTFDAVQGE